MSNLEYYLSLEKQVLEVRQLGGTDEDEDRLLDLMDKIWFLLTKDEKDLVNSRESMS